MTDPVRIPANHIDPDTALVMESAPYQPVNWEGLKLADRLPEATRAQLLQMAKAVL